MERFCNPEFYPPSHQGSGLVECIETGLPIFSIDTNTTGAKRFFACGYERFIEIYRQKVEHGSKPPNMYEVLQYDIPTKLFFDIDAKNCDAIIFKESCEKLINHCLEKLSDLFDHKFTSNNIVVLNSSTPQKCSVHIVFQYFFKNMETVKTIVELLTESIDNNDIKNMIDFSVYSRTRSFRLIYSSKKGKDNIFIIQGKSKLYNSMDVFDSLIQAKLVAHYQGPFVQSVYSKYHRHVFDMPMSNTPSPHNGSFANSHRLDKSKLPPRLLDYVKLVGNGTVVSSKQVGDFLYCIVKNMKCPYIKKTHRHNNQYFILNTLTLSGWFKCADTECPQQIYYKDNMRWLMIKK